VNYSFGISAIRRSDASRYFRPWIAVTIAHVMTFDIVQGGGKVTAMHPVSPVGNGESGDDVLPASPAIDENRPEHESAYGRSSTGQSTALAANDQKLERGGCRFKPDRPTKLSAH